MSRLTLSVALVAGALALSTLSGCIAVGGTSNSPTRGQELMDLKTALDRGAITQAEYDTSKANIVNRR
jgi:hypothetical protein